MNHFNPSPEKLPLAGFYWGQANAIYGQVSTSISLLMHDRSHGRIA
jgi:hypothetical protein